MSGTVRLLCNRRYLASPRLFSWAAVRRATLVCRAEQPEDIATNALRWLAVPLYDLLAANGARAQDTAKLRASIVAVLEGDASRARDRIGLDERNGPPCAGGAGVQRAWMGARIDALRVAASWPGGIVALAGREQLIPVGRPTFTPSGSAYRPGVAPSHKSGDYSLQARSSGKLIWIARLLGGGRVSTAAAP